MYERRCYCVVYLGYGIDLPWIRCSIACARTLALRAWAGEGGGLFPGARTFICWRVGCPQDLTVIKKLASAAKVTQQQAKDWLKKQAIWQIYLPAQRHIPRPKFDIATPNEVHQADLLFMPHDRVGRKTFRHALTVVDVASRYKEAEPLTSTTAAEVADALSRIYRRRPLKWPKLLQVDPGNEFMGEVSQLLAKH